MRKTFRMKQLESQHNMVICDLLCQLYVQTGSLAGVASALGVSVSTVSNWLARLGIPSRATVSPGEFLFAEHDEKH